MRRTLHNVWTCSSLILKPNHWDVLWIGHWSKSLFWKQLYALHPQMCDMKLWESHHGCKNVWEKDEDVVVVDCGRCGSRRHGCQESETAPKSDDTGRLPRVKTRSTQNTATLSRLLFQPKIASAKYAFTTFNLHLYIHCEWVFSHLENWILQKHHTLRTTF